MRVSGISFKHLCCHISSVRECLHWHFFIFFSLLFSGTLHLFRIIRHCGSARVCMSWYAEKRSPFILTCCMFDGCNAAWLIALRFPNWLCANHHVCTLYICQHIHRNVHRSGGGGAQLCALVRCWCCHFDWGTVLMHAYHNSLRFVFSSALVNMS